MQTTVSNLDTNKADKTTVAGLQTDVSNLPANKADKTVTDGLQTSVSTLTTNKADKLDTMLQGWVTVSTKGDSETSLSLNGIDYGTLYFNQGANSAKMFYNTGTGLMFTSSAGPMRFFPSDLNSAGNPTLSLNANGTATVSYTHLTLPTKA